MYFLNAGKLAQQLRAHTIHNGDKVIYFLLLLGQLIFRVTAFNSIPLLYHRLFHYVQYQLAITVQQPSLRFNVYHTIDHLLPIFLIPFCFVMLIWLYKLYGNNSTSYFIERVVCLNWPISVRIILITSVIFLGAAFYTGFYFTTKLMMLTQTAAADEGLLQSFYRLIGKINIISKLWAGLKTLKQATAIFAQMNLYSWYFYWASQGLALLSTLWYFCAMKKNLSKSRS